MSSCIAKKKVLLTLIPAVMLVAACGSDHKAATQVAAKVNKNEISVHQINNVLARTPNLNPDQAKAAGKQILEKLIDQELLVEQAVEKKIDRDPKVMQALESAKREILARAYLEQMTNGLAKPSPGEISEFYAKHPELFSDRRIFNINEISARGGPDLLPKLQERMSKAKALAEVGEWLKEQKIPFAANNTTKAAEQLPLELLPRFQQMKDGQIGVIPVPEGVLIVQLVGSKAAPIDEKSATPLVDQYLTNQRRVETVNKEMKQLHEKASIEYVGDFASNQSSAKSPIVSNDKPAQAVPQPTAAAPAPVVAAAQAAPAAPTAPVNPGAIDKVVSGLK